MDAVLLTWRWQNILSIWIIILMLFLLVTVAQQVMMRVEGSKAANG
jgi:hypothetical protein